MIKRLKYIALTNLHPRSMQLRFYPAFPPNVKQSAYPPLPQYILVPLEPTLPNCFDEKKTYAYTLIYTHVRAFTHITHVRIYTHINVFVDTEVYNGN